MSNMYHSSKTQTKELMAWLDTSLSGSDHKIVTQVIKAQYQPGSIPAYDRKALDVATKNVISIIQSDRPAWKQFKDE